jgi:hypothetical protein
MRAMRDSRVGVLIEEHGQTYMADGDADSDEARMLSPLRCRTQWHVVLR